MMRFKGVLIAPKVFFKSSDLKDVKTLMEQVKSRKEDFSETSGDSIYDDEFLGYEAFRIIPFDELIMPISRLELLV
ncbi:MAG: hypothetical protein ACK4Z9_06970 [Thermodesulfovibrionales bacterium]